MITSDEENRFNIDNIKRFPLSLISILFFSITLNLNLFVSGVDRIPFVFGIYIMPFWFCGVALFCEANNIKTLYGNILALIIAIAGFIYVKKLNGDEQVILLYIYPILFIFMLISPFLRNGVRFYEFANFQKRIWTKFGEIIGISLMLYILGALFCFAFGGGIRYCGSLLHGIILFGIAPILGVLSVPESSTKTKVLRPLP